MSNSEIYASMDTEFATGKAINKSLGDLNLDSSCPDKPNTAVGDGQSTLDVCGKILGGSSNGQTVNVLTESAIGFGQHSKDSKMATVGLNCEQQGIENSKTTDEQLTTDGQQDSGSPMAANGSINGQHGPGSSLNSGDATTPATKPHVSTVRGSNFPPKNKQTYAGLFTNNRVESEASKLTFIAPPLGNLVLGIEDIDSVESAFGFCLVGYVMGPRPRPLALKNFVTGWGSDVKFATRKLGWLKSLSKSGAWNWCS